MEVTLLEKLVLLMNRDDIESIQVNHANDQFCFDIITPEFVFDEICKTG